MLWKKETPKKGALYTDLCALVKSDVRANVRQLDAVHKNDVISTEKRKEGNEMFKKKDWYTAMELYNASLCMAEIGSENISLAYANRSVCFFKLEMFGECLIDIELAKDAGYAEHLMPKLNKRADDCLKQLELRSEQSHKFGEQLSYEANEQFPCVANVLKIESHDNNQFSFIAKEDIVVGKTIVCEKAFLTYVYTRFGWKCNICLKGSANLRPCKKCTTAMFCSDECQGNLLHEHECRLKYSDDTNSNGAILSGVRLMLLVIDMFSSVDKLMEFVSDTIESKLKELPKILTDEYSKYREFLKLRVPSSVRQNTDYLFHISISYEMLQRIPKIQKMFVSQKHCRFLMHLIGHHAYIINCNSIVMQSFSACTNTQNSIISEQLKEIQHLTMYTQAGIMINLFRHSCAPNVYLGNGDGYAFLKTIRPIKKGEHIFVSHFTSILTKSKDQRQQTLWNHREIKCTCLRCKGFTATMTERLQLMTDPDYQCILSESNLLECRDFEKYSTLENKCADFLNKHGHIMWCDELGSIILIYITTIITRVVGTSRLDQIQKLIQ